MCFSVMLGNTLYKQCYIAILQYTENTYFNVIILLYMQCYSAILQYTEKTNFNVNTTLKTRSLKLLSHCICNAMLQYCNTPKLRI